MQLFGRNQGISIKNIQNRDGFYFGLPKQTSNFAA
jgi:hypothetical protein